MPSVRPLKKNPVKGLPRQVQANADYLVCKGLDIEGLGTHFVERTGTSLIFTDPLVGAVSLDSLRSTVRVSPNDSTPGNLISKLAAGDGISFAELNDSLNEQLQINNTREFGQDYDGQKKVASETNSSNSFDVYDTLNFNTSEVSGTNTYRVQAWFSWGHNSAANDIRVQLVLDSVVVHEMRVEPKDTGSDQRIPGIIVDLPEDLAQGAHTLELQYRPANSSRVSRMYASVLEVWRVK